MDLVAKSQVYIHEKFTKGSFYIVDFGGRGPLKGVSYSNGAAPAAQCATVAVALLLV